MQHLKGEGGTLEAVNVELEKMGQPPESVCYSAAEIQQAVCTFRSAGVSRLAGEVSSLILLTALSIQYCLLQSKCLLLPPNLLSTSP